MSSWIKRLKKKFVKYVRNTVKNKESQWRKGTTASSHEAFSKRAWNSN
jgi:hypothetical protein